MNGDIIKLLKKDVLIKAGREIKYTSDCKWLERRIAEETNRQISVSTIKRFFGLVDSPFKPSKYTLETLAQYLGFTDWVEYRNCYDESRYSESSEKTWELLKSRIEIVTNHSLISLKQKAEYNPQRVLFRRFAIRKFENFLNSSKTATLFISPNGCGKSTTLIQLIENYFSSENAKYKNDIALLIDGGIFFNLYSKNSNIELLHQFLDFKITSSQEFHFQKNPEQPKRRIIIFIDDVDEIFFDKQRYHQLLENLMRMIMAYDNGWYKVVMTCRPENMDVFQHLIRKNPVFESSWFDTNFDTNVLPDARNIPLFTKTEIDAILKKIKFQYDYEYLQDGFRDILDIIRYPYILSLFVKEYSKTRKVTEIDLLQQYLKSRLYSPPYMEEKLYILEHFMELCKLGKESNTVAKEKLLSGLLYSEAYKELVSYGIIYEFTIPNGLFGSNTYVKFNQSQVFEYILVEKWRQDKPMDSDLFFKIKEYYKNNMQLQKSILKFYILLLYHSGKTSVLKDIQSKLKTSFFSKQLDGNPDSVSATLDKKLKESESK